MTVPGLALFMQLINTNPEQAQSPLLLTHRGHIHPKMGTVRSLEGGGRTHLRNFSATLTIRDVMKTGPVNAIQGFAFPSVYMQGSDKVD